MYLYLYIYMYVCMLPWSKSNHKLGYEPCMTMVEFIHVKLELHLQVGWFLVSENADLAEKTVVFGCAKVLVG